MTSAIFDIHGIKTTRLKGALTAALVLDSETIHSCCLCLQLLTFCKNFNSLLMYIFRTETTCMYYDSTVSKFGFVNGHIRSSVLVLFLDTVVSLALTLASMTKFVAL